VRVVTVPEDLVRIHPEWRDHSYFSVVRDEILVVDRSRKIVSTVAVDSSSGAQLDRGGRGSVGARSGGAMNLSVEEIREVQQVLIREGFDVTIDGKLDPETKEALAPCPKEGNPPHGKRHGPNRQRPGSSSTRENRSRISSEV
jgi:hypothetical protein